MPPTIIPFLTVKSVDASVEFYTKKLGFKVNEATLMPGQYAHIYLGDELCDNSAQIMFHPPGPAGAPPGTPPGDRPHAPSELLIQLLETGKGKEVVDEWHDKIVKLGVEAKEKPEDKPWNCRQAIFNDPDGNDLMFYFWLGPPAS
ncbi:Glyoxalase/Bleomycin resistance protein/Dihydroxybiphenyl dioxygenase, partial [Rickenella mellea]